MAIVVGSEGAIGSENAVGSEGDCPSSSGGEGAVGVAVSGGAGVVIALSSDRLGSEKRSVDAGGAVSEASVSVKLLAGAAGGSRAGCSALRWMDGSVKGGAAVV